MYLFPFPQAGCATYQKHDHYLDYILSKTTSVQWAELHRQHDSKFCVLQRALLLHQSVNDTKTSLAP